MKKVLIACSAAALLLLGVLFIFSTPAGVLKALLTVDTPLSRADAIVFMAGSFQEKAPAVATLYRDGYAPRILLANDGVFSSWSTKYNRNLHQVEWTEEELVRLGVPRSAIIKLPFYGSGTIYDALTAKRYASKNGLKSMLVVTSDYHTRRSRWSFEHVVTQYPVAIGMFSVRSDFGQKNHFVMYLAECVKLTCYGLYYGVLGNLGKPLS